MKTVNIIVPVYNEEQNIAALFEAIKTNIPDKYRFKVVFINDGSTDNSLEEIKKLKENNPEIHLISFTRNFGHQIAIFAGLEHCEGDCAITMDADFQDPPELIPKLLESWEAGFPLVFARRIKRHKDSFVKKITAKVYYWLLTVASKVEMHAQVGDFRLMDQKVVEIIRRMPAEAKYLRGIISWTGCKYNFVDYERPSRVAGKTKYSMSKMVNLALDGLFSFSMLPLKLGLILGISSISVGLLFMLYIIYDTLFNNEIYPLYKWLVVVILMFVGFLFILIWILAEYIGRIYSEKLNRPLYIIDDENSDKKT